MVEPDVFPFAFPILCHPFPRLVWQEKETVTHTKPLGALTLYTKDSYTKLHGKDPAADDLKVEKLDFPNGTSGLGVKALIRGLQTFK